MLGRHSRCAGTPWPWYVARRVVIGPTGTAKATVTLPHATGQGWIIEASATGAPRTIRLDAGGQTATSATGAASLRLPGGSGRVEVAVGYAVTASGTTERIIMEVRPWI